MNLSNKLTKLVIGLFPGFCLIFVFDYLVKYSYTLPSIDKLQEVFSEIILPFVVLFLLLVLFTLVRHFFAKKKETPQ